MHIGPFTLDAPFLWISTHFVLGVINRPCLVVLVICSRKIDRELLVEIARCSLATKVTSDFTTMLAEIVSHSH